MGKFATGVAVVSSKTPDGSPHGMTANSLASVSLEPPLVLVCIGHQRNTYTNVKMWDRFGINFLAQGQAPIARYYARDNRDRSGDVHIPWRLRGQESPEIDGAIAYMDCQVVAQYDHGDHAIFVAEVEQVVTREGGPLLYYDRTLRSVGR